uniref:Uncharacterized protein n=2 Tax=Meloidogyne TaxID=189290 RepID=A0A914LJZ5_MELIC
MGLRHNGKVPKEYTAIQLSSFILAEMKKMVQNRLTNQFLSEIVITVPAHFNDAQRQATKDAGEIAGLKVERIINEPTAAALAYGLDKGQKRELVAVFDLGGALQRFKDEAINAKHQLSKEEFYDFNLTYLSFDEKTKMPLHLVVKLLRKEFEDLIVPLLKRLVQPCKQCLKDAEVNAVDKIILVGGMTRVPAVQKIAQDIFKLVPDKSVNPDEAVAIGAAVKGAVLTGSNKDVLLLDVNPLSLGIETMGGINTIMIPRNTTIPVSKPQIFSTASNNQDTVTIKVIEGESTTANSPTNRVLDVFNLTGIRPAPRGRPQIEVTFSIDANGILSVTAKDKDTGKEQKVVITSRVKDEKEIQRMIQEAKEREAEDAKIKENTELAVEADNFCYSVKKDLDELKKNNLENEPQYLELEGIFNELKNVVDEKIMKL